jgi:uncharacterized protein
MRRKAQEIQTRDLVDQVIAQAQVCRLGFCKDNRPYIVPVSFGYDGTCIFFHTAPEGLKLEYIAANRQVCIELENEVRMIPAADQACNWSVSYSSVIGFGTVEEIVDQERKAYAFQQIMEHYSNREWSLNAQRLEKARVWAISIEQITGKQSKDKIAI